LLVRARRSLAALLLGLQLVRADRPRRLSRPRRRTAVRVLPALAAAAALGRAALARRRRRRRGLGGARGGVLRRLGRAPAGAAAERACACLLAGLVHAGARLPGRARAGGGRLGRGLRPARQAAGGRGARGGRRIRPPERGADRTSAALDRAQERPRLD